MKISSIQNVKEDKFWRASNQNLEENGIDPNLGRAASKVRTLYCFVIMDAVSYPYRIIWKETLLDLSCALYFNG